MRSLSAPMETLVMVNRPGPEKMTTYIMANTFTAERVQRMANLTIQVPPITYIYVCMPIRH